eukprot:m.41994 g.41994  ORF g.41994 m.41994 type:complete len:110 (+) comp10479_c0_seq1:75-404(+)
MSGRAQVLGLYRRLLRARVIAFENDAVAIDAGRKRIKDEFIKNKELDDERKLNKAIRVAEDVEKLLLNNVMQAQATESGNYRLNINERTPLMDNAKLSEVDKGKDAIVV